MPLIEWHIDLTLKARGPSALPAQKSRETFHAHALTGKATTRDQPDCEKRKLPWRGESIWRFVHGHAPTRNMWALPHPLAEAQAMQESAPRTSPGRDGNGDQRIAFPWLAKAEACSAPKFRAAT